MENIFQPAIVSAYIETTEQPSAPFDRGITNNWQLFGSGFVCLFRLVYDSNVLLYELPNS